MLRRQVSADPDNFAPIAPLAVAAYIAEYGYSASDAHTWKVRPSLASYWGGKSALEIKVDGHSELAGHTWYRIGCQLENSSMHLGWCVQRRLHHLRNDLYTRVKNELGNAYGRHFDSAPFALHGGVPGTTARLNGWFAALGSCINQGEASPSIVALTLLFLDTPPPPTAPDLMRVSPVSPPLQLDQARCEGADLSLENIDVDVRLAITGGDGPLILGFRLLDGTTRVVNFGSRAPPYGIDFKPSKPLRVNAVRGAGLELGVQLGWELETINGKDITSLGSRTAFTVLKVALPPSCPNSEAAVENMTATQDEHTVVA
eukprot:TRINITY_DN37485_c0_g1_i1.p1 TRINITY_DN37485_c0_g1~~TRINITY_DN37485_c0_g1_i1.p1  ORF type:complete len:316 (+),score=31.05 TRINITY_DN37485_c0_g1_i1:79-1026(+)